MPAPPLPPGFVPEPSRQTGMFAARPPRRAGVPALPPGFEVDPLATIRSSGANITSGFRDPARNRRVGGVPNSEHLDADAVDLTPGKGQSWGQLRSLADGVATSYGRGARVVDESKTGKPHIHLQLPGWGKAPALSPTAAMPPGFKPAPSIATSAAPLNLGFPTGKAHDGDTFGLTSGQNARLLGVDAFELNQQGRSPSGAMIPLGQAARGSILPFVGPGATFTPNGTQTFGRPVGSLDNGGDAGESLLFQGNALAAPEFLKGNPELMGRYMEAERFARLNGRGAFGNTFQTPDSFRAGNPNPWEAPEGAAFGEGQAVFADEPTPFMGLRPEIEKGYLAIWQDPASKPDDLLAFAQANGFNLDPADVRKRYEERDKGASPTSEIQYREPPRLLTNVGDGAAGATVRGFADPFNLLDELGGVADTLTGLDGRESIWNSDRRFGDILYNNIDQNRAILGFDEANHPWARLGGQVGSGIVMPIGGGIRTVGGLARIGALEGGLAGLGAGEGNALERMPNAAAGAALGTAGGFALGGAIRGGSAAARRLGLFDSASPGAMARAGQDAAFEAAPVANDGLQAAGPTPASRLQPDGGIIGPRSAAMRMDDAAPEIKARQRDYINLPPPPPGFVPESPMLRVEDASRMIDVDEAAKGLSPEDVLRPSDLAPDERAGLGTRKFGGANGARPVYQRGPVDLVGFVRSRGGLRDEGGDLRHLGIDNKPRKIDFAEGEGFLGGLVRDDGHSLDDMAEAAWEAGYFPEFHERPSVNDFLNALADTHSGASRRFLPDDLAEVSRFEDDLAERYRLEAADQELPELSKVGNFRLDKIESEADIGRALAGVRAAIGDNPSLGRVSHEKTAELAEQLGMTPEHFLKMRRGAPLSHAEAHALGQANAAALEDTVARAKRALNGSEEDKAAFLRSAGLTSALTDFASGARAEAGRTLSQYRMASRSTKFQAEAIKRLIETRGGHESIDEMAQAIIELAEDPAQANRFIQQMTKPTWKDKAVQLLYFVRLSGIRTHAVNTISNTLTALGSLPEHATAAMIGQFRRSSTDRVMASEIGPRLYGMISGAQAGLRQARRTFLTGETSDGFNRIEANVMEPIQGPLGAVVRTPGRLLAAEDEFFKSVGRFSELNGLAVRQARSEGLRGEALADRVDELVRNPPEGLLARANEFARYQTFQNELGNFGKDLVHLANRTPALKLVFPFIRTPVNLFKYALERSPGAFALKRVRDDLAAGGARRDLAISRISLGSSLGALTAMWAAQGLITGGGPADENERRLLLANGWQPYSIKVGDRYVSYERMDPIATTLGIAADYVEKQSAMTDAQRQKVATLLTGSIINNMASKTWFSGIADISEAIGDPARYGEGYVRNQVAGLAVPAASSQLAQTVDLTRRETHTIPEAIRQRLPGLSDNNLPARNIWGEEIKREGYLGPDIASPFATSTVRHDPLTEEMQRIGARIGKPQRDGMPWDVFNEFQRIAGQNLRQSLEPLVASPEWQAMGDQAKLKLVAKLKTAARKDAREQLGLAAPKKGDAEDEPDIPPPPAGFVIPPPPAGFNLAE